MPSIETKYFGSLDYLEESVFHFPQGMPAFEDEKSFVFIQTPEREPLVFLQSVARPDLCFLALPILVVDQKYQLEMAPEDLEQLGLDAGRQPALDAEVLVLALISAHGEFLACANLMAPIVLNVKRRQGVQAIRRDSRYSHQHPLKGKPDGVGGKPDGAGTAGQAC